MYDRRVALETLKYIEKSLNEISEWTRDVSSVDDFYMSPSGMILLNAVCMKLLAMGEEFKGLDRRTGGELLKSYPSVPWREVIGLRDVIAHHYFDLDADIIFTILQVDIQPLSDTVREMIVDLEVRK